MKNVADNTRYGGIYGHTRCPKCSYDMKADRFWFNGEISYLCQNDTCDHHSNPVIQNPPDICVLEPDDIVTVKVRGYPEEAYRKIGKGRQKLWKFTTASGGVVLLPKSVMDELNQLVWQKRIDPARARIRIERSRDMIYQVKVIRPKSNSVSEAVHA
jgi:hypothetical protein